MISSLPERLWKYATLRPKSWPEATYMALPVARVAAKAIAIAAATVVDAAVAVAPKNSLKFLFIDGLPGNGFVSGAGNCIDYFGR